MNYRHIYHAGNHADVLKHAALLAVLARMQRKDAPLAVIETHAGLGLYDLTAAEAARSPEWRAGIGALADSPAPALQPLLQAVAAVNAPGEMQFYPGSPELARQALRPQDRYAGCELHPEDAATLKRRYAADKRMQIHARDGWAALKALLPPAEKRGLVLIDPPYEQPGEMAVAARAILAARSRFLNGVYVWWRPLKDAEAAARADDELFSGGAPGLLEATLRLGGLERGLTASSVAILNPPFGLEADLEALAAALEEAIPAALRAQARVLRRGVL